jgi:parallel beta-helix repeat protein
MEGVAATECRIKLKGNTISGNGTGIVLAACQGSLTSNRLNDNRRYGLQLQNSPLRVSGNELARNGLAGLRAADGRAVAWGNALFQNGRYDMELFGSEDFRAPGNWWQLPPEQIDRRINDGRRQQGVGTVIFNPPLANRPPLPLSSGSGTATAAP